MLRIVICAGRVPVPDERYDFLCDYYKPARYGVSKIVVVSRQFNQVTEVNISRNPFFVTAKCQRF